MSNYYAWRFDGSANCGLQYPTPPQWQKLSPFTVAFWVKAHPSANANNWILDIGEQKPLTSLHWLLDQAKGTPMTAVFGFFGEAAAQNRFDFTPYIGKWIHVATTFDPVTRMLRSLVNGQEKHHVAVAAKVTTLTPGAIRIGIPIPSRVNFNGLIDEIRIWDRPLSDAELLQQMYSRLAVAQEVRNGLISYVNLPTSTVDRSTDAPPMQADLVGAIVRGARDLVTNEPVVLKPGVTAVPSSVPTGGPTRAIDAGEVGLFQEPNFNGHSWVFASDPVGLDIRSDLSTCTVGSIRVGPRTGATLFSNPSFQGTAQDAMADLPAIPATRIGSDKHAVTSLQVWSAAGASQRGRWAIRVQSGQYLSGKPDPDTAVVPCGPAVASTKKACSTWRSWDPRRMASARLPCARAEGTAICARIASAHWRSANRASPTARAGCSCRAPRQTASR